MALHPAGAGDRWVDLVDIATGLAATARSVVLDEGDATRRYARVLSTPVYEAWVIRWSTSAQLGLHDHGGSSGAVVVVGGELLELRDGDPPRLRVLGCGDVATIDARTVHAISNRSRADALSVHVYSPPLSDMNFY